MENKKLQKILLTDLNELEELLTEKGTEGLDELELEFALGRIKGAQRIIQKLSLQKHADNMEQNETFTQEMPKPNHGENDLQKQESETGETGVDEIEPTQAYAINAQEKVAEPEITEEEELPEKREEKVTEPEPMKVTKEKTAQAVENEDEEKEEERDGEMSFEKEEPEANSGNTLGDKFLTKKSVNEILSGVSANLEHKLSNRPVTSIKQSIGINDRFQYIRELFDGRAEVFDKSVNELDEMANINEAVKYLQENFKWKKNETSLKFVHLVKRRFSNE